MAVTWDAKAYEEVADVQFAWGRQLLDSRKWRGDETVLDAGCGTGRLAAEILERLPRGSVTAVDVDPSMVQAARERLARFGPRAQVVEADLRSLPSLGPFDVIFSNAVLHWIADHDEVLHRFFKLLNPGGELLIQCGGAGNLQKLRGLASKLQQEPRFAPYFRAWEPPWNYEDADPTQERLLIHGYAHPAVDLRSAPTTFPDEGSFRKFLRAVVLNPYLQRLPEPLRDEFVEAVVRSANDQMDPARTLDYVRLTIRARRPG